MVKIWWLYNKNILDFKRGGVLYEPGAEKSVGAKWRVELKPLEVSGEVIIKPKVVLLNF